MTNVAAERDAFEAWYAQRHPKPTHENSTRAHCAKMDDWEVWQARAGAAPAAVAPQGEWRIDTSAGREILVYKGCSVIEDADARYVLSLIAAASQPAALAGPARDWPDTCDGKEQEAFETWAQRERHNMEQHPLHYLFLDAETNAARQGWRAGLLYAVGQMKTQAAPALEAPAHQCCNSWFLSLPEGRQAVLRENQWMLADAAYQAGRESSRALEAPAAPAAPRREVTDGTRTLLEDCISAIRDYAGSRPEEGESWESWFEAAFDLCQSRVRRVFDDHARAAAPQAPAAPALSAAPIPVMPRAITSGLGLDDSGEEPAYCVMAAFRQEDDARYALSILSAGLGATAAPAAPVTPAAAMAALKAAFASDPEYAWSWHCAAWSCAHDEGLDTGAANRAAARLMYMAFGCDTSKHPNFLDAHRTAAPAAPAVDTMSDTALLDAMERERIAVIPEFEGPWDAQIFGEDEAALAFGSGATPRKAIAEALASLEARKAHRAAQAAAKGEHDE